MFTVERHFPIRILAWFAVGIVCLAVALLALSPAPPKALLKLRDPAFCLALAGFGILCLIYRIPSLLAWLSGPKRFVLREGGFDLGQEAIGYERIEGITLDVGHDVTRLILAGGRHLALRWDIWADSEDWNALLMQKTYDRLLATAQAAVARGERVEFGKGVDVDGQRLCLKGRPVTFGEISSLHIAEGSEHGASYRTIQVTTPKKAFEIAQKQVVNQHVLFGLLRARLG